MNRWQRELKEVKELYESYRKFMPTEVMDATDAYLKWWYPRAEHIDLYQQLILRLDHHYYFVLSVELRTQLDLIRLTQSLSL